jgi:hypothetical protein
MVIEHPKSKLRSPVNGASRVEDIEQNAMQDVMAYSDPE